MSYSQRTKPLVGLIEQAARRHSTWQVFSDFLEMSAISISNPVDPVHWEEREKHYMDIIKRYSRKELDLFPQMLAELVEALEQCAQEGCLNDILGKVFHELELHNKYKGQFFTPMSVCDMTGMVSAADADISQALEERGYFTVCEPCIGSGALALGLANALTEKGVNHCQQMVITGVDVDLKCVHMAYLQLSLYGIPAVIIHGNSLMCEEWSRWYTPVYIVGGWIFRQHCGITTDGIGWETDERLKMTLDPMYAAFRQIEALFREKPEPLTGTGYRPPETMKRKKMWLFFFEPRKEEKMGAVYGSMTNSEINELARNLRETGEYDALLSLSIENGVDESEVKAFYDGKTQALVSEDNDSPADRPENEISPETGNPASAKEIEKDTDAGNPASEIENAVDKLRREMAASKETRVPAGPITNRLIELCEQDEAFCKAVEQAHKGLQKCCNYVYEQARNRVGGSCGYLEDNVIFGMAEDYYRLDDAEIERKKAGERKAAEDARAKATAERKAAASKKATEKTAPPKKEKGVPDQLSLF